MQHPFVLKENQGRNPEPYNVLGMPVHLKVAGKDTDNQFSMFSATYTKNQGPPLHQHNVDETFYVTEGEFLVQAGEQQFHAKKGDTVFIPRNLPHTTLTLSETGNMLFMVNPTGNVEVVFERLHAYPEPPSIEEVVRLHEELGFKILGPPLSAVD